MSAFLGPIHYWLYNKIQWHEGLLEDMIAFAKSKNVSVDEILVQTYEKYGAPDLSPLEAAIDHGNIHGWLQTRIQSVEYRIAAIVTELITRQALNLEDLVTVYKNNGKKAAKTITSEIKVPQDLYKLVFDFMLEGMPCDHANEVNSTSDSELVWETRDCLHKVYWDAVAGDVKHFYELRDAWTRSFVNGVDEAYTYTHEANGAKSITKR